MVGCPVSEVYLACHCRARLRPTSPKSSNPETSPSGMNPVSGPTHRLFRSPRIDLRHGVKNGPGTMDRPRLRVIPFRRKSGGQISYSERGKVVERKHPFGAFHASLRTTTMRYYSLLQFLFLSSLARARSTQFPLVNQSNICPASVIDGANATGTGTFDAWELVFDQYYHGSTNLSWAMTVDEGFQTGDNNVSFPTIDTSLWIGQPPGIDLYDGANGFSACAFQFGNLPLNTIERGQDDDGSCYQTFSPACVTALTDQVARFAQWQTSSYTGGPYSNLTPPILGYVCGNIQAAIGSYSGNGPVEHAFPAECQPYFQHGSDPSPNTDAFGKFKFSWPHRLLTTSLQCPSP